MQYLYSDGDLYYFMDNETYEQIPISHDLIEEALPFIRENDQVQMKFHEGRAFSVEPQNFVILEVTETEPGVRGDTATNVTNPRRSKRAMW